MDKSSLSQKTRVKKVLLAILHHNKNLDLNKFLKKIDSNKLYFLLIVVDGRFNFKIQKKIKNKIIFKKKNKNAIPINRNIAINYAIKKKFDLILFLDSDIIPSHNIVLNHIKAHKKYNNFVGIGGPVKPSFKLQKFNLWEFLDGKLSWFQCINTNSDVIVKSPYHIPTCNVSFKVSYLKKFKIRFNKNLFTGEDAQFFNDLRKKKLDSVLSHKCNVKHKDRTSFINFFFHHMQWGKHQYYTLYQKHFPKKMFYIYNMLFIFLYPLIFIFVAAIQTFYVAIPWIKINKLNFFLSPFFFIIHFFKSIWTYYESFKFKYIFK